MKLLWLLTLLPTLVLAQTGPNSVQTDAVLTSTTLQRTQFVATRKHWQIETDALDSDGDPELELKRKKRIELSINETSTFPLIIIDADDALKDYLSMMKNMLKAEPRQWPENIVKPSSGACAAYVSKLFEQDAAELPLALICYLPYRGGTAIVSVKIAVNANASDRDHLSALLGSIRIK